MKNPTNMVPKLASEGSDDDGMTKHDRENWLQNRTAQLQTISAYNSSSIPGAVLLIEKLKGGHMAMVASKHNKRVGTSINSSGKSCSPNYCLWGPDTPGDIAEQSRQLISNAGISKPKVNAVRVVEVVVGLSPNSGKDEKEFFMASMAWVANEFGGFENLLSADVHNDEGAPHMHLLLVPLDNGKLHGSAMVGAHKRFVSRLVRFGEAVCQPRGLRSFRENLTAQQKDVLSTSVIRHFHTTDDPALQSPSWPLMTRMIKSDPQPFANFLGVRHTITNAAPCRSRTFTQIMTSKGKGPSARAGE